MGKTLTEIRKEALIDWIDYLRKDAEALLYHIDNTSDRPHYKYRDRTAREVHIEEVIEEIVDDMDTLAMILADLKKEAI